MGLLEATLPMLDLEQTWTEFRFGFLLTMVLLRDPAIALDNLQLRATAGCQRYEVTGKQKHARHAACQNKLVALTSLHAKDTKSGEVGGQAPDVAR